MRIQRLNESNSIQNIRNNINEFYSFLKDIRPLVLERYKELCEDKQYFPEIGEKPFYVGKGNEHSLIIADIVSLKKGFSFEFQYYDGGEFYNFYIHLTDEEIEDFLMKKDATRYNI